MHVLDWKISPYPYLGDLIDVLGARLQMESQDKRAVRSAVTSSEHEVQAMIRRQEEEEGTGLRLTTD